MAQAVASMAGLCSASKVTLESSLVSCGSSQLRSSSSSSRVAVRRGAVVPVRALRNDESELEVQSRRSMLGLLAATVAAGAMASSARAEPPTVLIKPPPPPSGGLPGTENSDQARELDLPLKERFFLQPLSPAAAVARAKESAEAIVGVKPLIQKKAWPYVQNELRSKAGYLRFDLNTIIAAKPKAEKTALKALVSSLYDSIDELDYAARSKSLPKAEKSYSETVSKLEGVLAKL